MNPKEIAGLYALSPMQEGLLFHAVSEPQSRAYFVQMCFDVEGPLDPKRFVAAWEHLCARHDILRTAFAYEGIDRPLQAVYARRDVEVHLEDLRHLDAATQRERIERFCEEDRARGFDLQRDVLSRMALLRTGEERHRLIWSYHHVLLDGWSLGVLQKEFAELYAASGQGRAPRLAQVRPYRDFITWLSARDAQASRAFWKAALADYETATTVPGCASDEVGMREHRLALDAELTQALVALAASLRVTLNTLVQSLWGMVLGRYNDVSDVVFGAVVSGRPDDLEGAMQMVGPFINTVPVRIAWSPQETFAALVARVQAAAIDSAPHQHTRAAEILAEHPLGRALFDHVVVFDNYPATQASDRGDVTFRSLEAHDWTHYGFSIVVVPGDSLLVKFLFDAAQYAPQHVAGIADAFATAMRDVVDHPDKTVASIEIVSDGERGRIDTWAGVAAPAPESTVVALFEAQVARTPEAVAVAFGDLRMSYRELNARANALAADLRDRVGVRPGDRVGIHLDRSDAVPVAVLGILKAGAAYVPIDTSYPQERIRTIEREAGLRAMVTEESVRALTPDEANPPLAATPNDPAYLLYTSGTTGTPKGCVIAHASLAFYLRWANEYYFKTSEPGNFALFSPLSFDLTVTSVFLPLLRGKTLTILPHELEPEAVLEAVFGGALGVDTVKLTPSHCAMLEFTELRSSTVSLAIVGGEAFTIEHARKLWALNPSMRIVNEYGPTEATVGCIVHEAQHTDVMMPIGRPIAGSTVAILDSVGRAVPVGALGEIYLGGPGLSLGYHERPDLTAERFVDVRGTRMYRTGDFARWLPGGEIAYVGRRDQQVKIRGHRVELGEVEAALQRCEGIGHSAVALDGATLIAYVEATQPLQTLDLRAQLRAIVPEFMIPSTFVRLARMPLNANGKVDRTALASAQQSADGEVARVGARDAIERAIASIWSEVLGRDGHAIDENFFEAGGHSLKAMQVVSRIRKALQVGVALRTFLAAPTIAALAQAVRSAKPAALLEIPPAPPARDYPLSHAQERIWLIHQMGGNIAYNMPEAFALEGELNVPALRAAFSALIDRHESLRTTFVLVDGEPRARIEERAELPLTEIDLRNETDPQAQARAWAQRDAMTPFALDRSPLLRMHVMRVADTAYVIQLTIHHIIGDGWSLMALHQEFLAMYAAFTRGENLALAPLRLQYKDFAVWQRGLDQREGERYWLNRLRGCAERLALAYDREPRDEERDFRGATLRKRLDPALALRLRRLAAQRQTTLSNTVLSAFGLALWHQSRQGDFCVGVSEANRDGVDIEPVVGFFVNILPIRFVVSSDTTVGEFLDATTTSVYEAFDHRDYPFDLLVAKMNPGRVANRQPLLNVVYGFQSFRDVRVETQANRASDLAQVKSFGVPFKTSKFDLCLFVSEVDDTLLLELEYDTGLFETGTIDLVLEQIVQAMRVQTSSAQLPLHSVALSPGVAPQVLAQCVQELNATAAPYPRDASVHELFSQIARAHPDNVAVAMRNRRLTYDELERRSNDVAALLLERGIEPETFVCVLIDRSVEMLVSLLGILKAGAAYVPLMSTMPFERLRQIADDARAPWLIAERKHLRIANKLQWEVQSLASVLFIDSDDIDSEVEESGGIMDRAVWDYIAEEAYDDISGGGWKDSYTGEWLSRDVMDEYGQNIVAKLGPLLHRGSRVLEIGCASGISMFRLAPLVAKYVGTDLSAGIVAWSEGEAQRRGLENIELHALAAHEVDRVGEGGFDVVILNSVIECFPGHNYLRSVLRAAIGLLNPQGYLFLGNLWDADLKPAFVASLLEFRRAHPERAERMKLDRSDELYVSRAYLEELRHDLPEIESIAYSTMLGTARSELSEFGFDALIRVRKAAHPLAPEQRARRQFDRRALAANRGAAVAARGGAQSLAYMMYTSGTSGKPKGVMIEHRAVVRLVRGTNFLQLGEEDAVLQAGALGFDASTFEIWGPLLNGGCVVLPEGQSFLHPAELARVTREHRVSALFLTTGLFNQIVDLDIEALGSLKVLLTGGERASPARFNAVLARYPHLRLLHVYGPTENTTFSTYHEVRARHTHSVPIGRPIANATAIVLDEAGALAPFGVSGELCVGGDGLARGYWNDPELTARKFVSSPLDPDARLYRTGDLVRVRADGEIEFLGRLDTQVKIRGYRIELEELEGALLAHDRVTGAAVVANELAPGETELVAFVTGADLHTDALLEFLRTMVPEYMLPSKIVIEASLPLNSSGKIDRRRLIVPASQPTHGTYVAPATDLEVRLSEMWQRLLHVPRVGVEDNFFALGGHSLKVARFVSMMQMELGLEVPLSAVFRAPTVREIAKHIVDVSRFDRRLIEEAIAPLNDADQGPAIFAFPPGSGYCLSYLRLAKLTTNPFLGLSFIEAESRLDDYVHLIRAAQPQGPYVLFGYSAGGKLAFRVAQELERAGEVVSDLIIFDAARYLEPVVFTEAEISEVAAEFLDEITSRVLREQALQRIRRYRTFIGASVERGTIGADIHLVVAEESLRTVTGDTGKTIATLDGWAELTRGRCREYQGSGRHRDMLTPPHLERNADIFRTILAVAVV